MPVTKSIIFPPELEDAITRRAELEGRSFTKQVIYMLRQYLTSQTDIEHRLREVEKAILTIAEEIRRR